MPTGILEGIGEAKTRDLLTFLLTEPLAPAPIERKGAPPPRSRAEFDAVIQAAKTLAEASEPAKAEKKPLNILLVAGVKDHGASEHDYPAWQTRWTTLLGLAENVKVAQADTWPTPQQWTSADVVAIYNANPAWEESKAKDLDAFLSRGGGLVILHMAVHGRDAPAAFADRIGLAWGPNAKFRHGPLELTFRDREHPITRGFPEKLSFIDESYWALTGDLSKLHLLADGPEEDQPRPLLWTREHAGGGRVFVCIPGHYTWTFDDPLYRLLLLRGLAWVAHDDVTRLENLATVGARISP
jgi:type 1 glutamine amidotransferase